MGADAPNDTHLTAGWIAAYVDDSLAGDERARVEAHLATCAECRGEVIAVSRLVRAPVRRRRRYLVAASAIAAAAIVLVVIRPVDESANPPRLREGVLTTAAAPAAIAPRGAVAAAPRFIWSAVPGADLYGVSLFDETGRVLWESRTRDTSIALPPGVHVIARSRYYWKVDAQTGWGRWVGSELTPFSIGTERP